MDKYRVLKNGKPLLINNNPTASKVHVQKRVNTLNRYNDDKTYSIETVNPYIDFSKNVDFTI